MSAKINSDDIVMKESTFSSFWPRFNIRKCPPKRTYLEMLKDSEESTINSRFDNYKFVSKNIIFFEKKTAEEKSKTKHNNNMYDSNNPKKNLMIKKKLEYDEEKEKKFVENYYRIKNAELIKLRFGTE